MSITSTRVKVIPFLYGGCGGQGVQPMGSCSLLAIVEETQGPGGAGVVRPFVSLDDGETWEEEIHHLSQGGLAQTRIRMGGSQIVLGGMTGPQFTSEFEAYGSVGFRTANGGRQWRSIMTPDNFAALFDPGNDFWEIVDYVVAGPKMFALGFVTSFGVSKSYLTSLDGGITFDNPRSIAGAPNGLSGGAYLGNDILIFVGTTNPAKVHRSIDGGDTWTSITLPGAAVSTALRGVTPVGPLSSGRVVVVGTRAGAAVAFFSTDFGQTWTQSTLSGGVTAQGAMDVVAPSALDVVMGLNVNAAQVAAGKRPLALSTDGGATFADFGAYATPLNPALGYVVQQLTVADDGAILAMVQTTDVTNTTPNEIWRAVIDGFVGNGPGVALNRRITNQAILVWDQATGQYGPAVEWVGPRHVMAPGWELEDPQPSEAAPATKFNESLEVVEMLGAQLQALQQAQRGMLETQAALVVASDAAAELNNRFLDDGTFVPNMDDLEPFMTDDELSAEAGALRIFGEEMLVASSSLTDTLAQAQHLAAEVGETLDATIAAVEGDIVLAADMPPDVFLRVRRYPPWMDPSLEDDSAAAFRELNKWRERPENFKDLREPWTDDDLDRRYPRWFKQRIPDMTPSRAPTRGEVPELLDDSIRNVSDSTDAAADSMDAAADALDAAMDAAGATTAEAWADAFGGCVLRA